MTSKHVANSILMSVISVTGFRLRPDIKCHRLRTLLYCLISLVINTAAWGCSGAPPSPNPTIEALNAELQRLQVAATATAIGNAAALQQPLGTTGVATASVAPTPAVATPEATRTIEDAVALIKAYTVFVGTNTGSGSGVSLGQGRVLTNHHVIEDASQIMLRLADGRQEPARVVRDDPRRDLALLETHFADAPGAPRGDSRAIRAGESLLAVGYPKATILGVADTSLTRGVFSGRWQSPKGIWHVQTDTPSNPGNSGGPLADSQGRLIGVVTFGIRDTVGLNFAVASDEIDAFINSADSPTPPPIVVAAPGVRPALNGHAMSARTAAAGTVVTLIYDVENGGSAPVTAVLGASIRPSGDGAWTNDSANDTRVTLSAGRTRVSRAFRVPESAPAGSYEVAWSLLSPDMQTSFGLDSESGALTVTRSVGAAPTPVPTALLAPSNAAPANAVRQFYAAVNAGDFGTAWGLLSPSAQQRLGSNAERWKTGYATTRGVSVSSSTTRSQTSNSAVVDVAFSSTDASTAGSVTKHWRGSWTLVLIDGQWRLDVAQVALVD